MSPIRKLYLFFFYHDRDLIFSPSATHILRLNSAPQKCIFLAKKYPYLGGKKYFPGRLMKIKYQMFETAQVFQKLEFAEGKGICAQRTGNVLKMHGKTEKKT